MSDLVALLASSLEAAQQLVRERDGAIRELAERYEEISLLYVVARLLGNDLPAEVVAETLLRELSVTIGANAAACLLADRSSATLTPVASYGLGGHKYPEVATHDSAHLAASVFRSGKTETANGSSPIAVSEPVLGELCDSILAVAINRPNTALEGDAGEGDQLLYNTREFPTDLTPLGVMLFGRRNGDPAFTAGDQKLVGAIAAQFGNALHNAALMREARERERFEREVQLAHDLQLKLLPDPSIVGPEARAAARIIPAERVGGDFYLFVRLDAARTGVLIGDVSGHGYQAALVMALALSAAGIHIRAANDPADTLSAVAGSLLSELESTEMSVTMCYCIIDEASGTLSYSNAGHPHVFVQNADGELNRLLAQSPPIGFADASLPGDVLEWGPGFRLVCFTDGVADARNTRNARLGEDAILEILRSAGPDVPPTAVLDRIMETVGRHTMGTILRDDITVLVVDRTPAQS